MLYQDTHCIRTHTLSGHTLYQDLYHYIDAIKSLQIDYGLAVVGVCFWVACAEIYLSMCGTIKGGKSLGTWLSW